MLFHRKAHSTEHPLRGCTNLTADSTEAMRIMCLAQGHNVLMSGIEPSISVSRNRHSNNMINMHRTKCRVSQIIRMQFVARETRSAQIMHIDLICTKDIQRINTYKVFAARIIKAEHVRCCELFERHMSS